MLFSIASPFELLLREGSFDAATVALTVGHIFIRACIASILAARWLTVASA